MKGMPARLQALWPTIGQGPCDPSSELAQALVRAPARLGVNRYVEGRSPLGWATHGLGFLGGLPVHARDWVVFLLRAGADPDAPLVRAPRYTGYASERSLRDMAFGSPRNGVLEAFSLAGLDPLGSPRPGSPGLPRLRLSQVLRALDLDLLERYVRQGLPPWEEQRLLGQVAFDWSRDPGLAAQAIQRLEPLGHTWHRGDLELLWDMCLRYPGGPWLGWAVAHWQAHQPHLEAPGTRQRRGWGWPHMLGQRLILCPHPGHDRVRATLEALLPEAFRADWSPQLPDAHDSAEPTLPRTLRADHWTGACRAIQWAMDWGVPRTARTDCGLPWAMWVILQANRSCEVGTGSTDREGCQRMAWQALECLVRAGVKLGLRPRNASRLGKAGRTTAAGLMDDPVRGLDWTLGPWRARMARLKKALAMDRAIQRRLDRSGQDAAPAPIVARPRPRM